MIHPVSVVMVAGALLALGSVESQLSVQRTDANLGHPAVLESHPSAQNAGRVGHPADGASVKEARVTHHAAGAFDVKLTPDPFADKAADSTLGRMLIEKQFHGDLDGTSKGAMLTVATSVKGSGVYVAVERVTGTLQGRKGNFALHHTGIMTRGAPELNITVVPDSGTEELEGISGSMMIKIEGGKHSYEFEYSLPEQK